MAAELREWHAGLRREADRVDGREPRAGRAGRGLRRIRRRRARHGLDGKTRSLVRFHNKCGTAEQWIKEGKQATHWTRLSCHRFRANEVRPQLAVLAYNLNNL